MPSGPKKRKAAKKKKQKENNNPQGNDELKSQDEKGSDGGEVSSPEYRDRDDNHRNPFNEGSGEEVLERDPPAVQPNANDANSVQEVLGDDIQIEEVEGRKEDSVILIEGDVKPKESFESKDVSFEHIETAKESCFGNDFAIGTTANDESVTEKNSKEEGTACHELKELKSVDSSPSEMTLVAENAPVEKTGNSSFESSVNSVKAVPSLSDVENGDTGSVLLEKTVAPSVGVTDLAMKINADHVYPLTDENARTPSLQEAKPKERDTTVLDSPSASLFTTSTNGAEHIKDSETPECSENKFSIGNEIAVLVTLRALYEIYSNGHWRKF
ncbi:hypothetical protein RIF29_42103 [Crotalaria pallida]|uniref:Uncharacterized protein n=1 Tax=Crotalaria pallida TaxID=3830 RepID=A0AAN9E7J6_CROPI